MTTAVVLILTIFLAAANGSNDVPKGVAALAGDVSRLCQRRAAEERGEAVEVDGSLSHLPVRAADLRGP